MSAISRVISGSAASWSRLGVNLMARIVLVPVFLSHWERSVYGLWIGIFALATLIQFIDIGHHNYVGFEALRLGADSRSEIARLYKSAVRVALCVSGIELLAVSAFVLLGFHIVILGAVSDGIEHLSQAVAVIL